MKAELPEMIVDAAALGARVARPSVMYPLAGAVLAATAPVGLVLLRRFLIRDDPPSRHHVRNDLATIVYVAASTITVALLGRALGRSAERLAELSVTDELTGLLNRRAFYPKLAEEIERSRRLGQSTTLLLIDLDQLKTVNDRHGHAAGDRALDHIARAIRREMRWIDAGARLGGDEFALLAVGTDDRAAKLLAERVRATVSRMTATVGPPVTASVGVVTFNPVRDRLGEVSELVRAADRALYTAKHGGRNRVAFETLAGC